MTAPALALVAGAGTYLPWTAIAFGWRDVGPQFKVRMSVPRDVAATAAVLLRS